jgi:hypothetical protein
MNKIILTTLLLLACQAGGVQAQTCNTSNYLTTPTSRFVLNTDGTALDKKTGLLWKRCLEGYSWNGSTCTGARSAANWQNALKQAAASTFIGKTDWRLPNAKELESIAERGCVDPQVNLSVFPNMPTTFIWSSTPDVNNTSLAWAGGSGYQNHSSYSKNFGYGVLLVRNTP